MKFQNVSNKCDYAEFNELESIKYSVRCALCSSSVGIRGNYTNVKYFCVDVPLSKMAFASYFAIEYRDEDNFKKTLSVDDLKHVLGSNWHIFHFSNSETTRRVIGEVQLHYRMKKIAGFEGRELFR